MSVCINAHFLAFNCNLKLLKRPNTSSRRNHASEVSVPNEITSSRYTKHRGQRMPHNTRSISLSNVAGGSTKSEWHHPKLIVRLFLGISQSFVPQIVFTKPEIYILFSIFWTVRKSRLSQTSDVDNCSR